MKSPVFHKVGCVPFGGTRVLFSSGYLFSPLGGGLVGVWNSDLEKGRVRNSTLDYETLVSWRE